VADNKPTATAERLYPATWDEVKEVEVRWRSARRPRPASGLARRRDETGMDGRCDQGRQWDKRAGV